MSKTIWLVNNNVLDRHFIYQSIQCVGL